MIPIAKGAAPAVLTTRGVAAAKALCDAYDKDQAAYDDGSEKFKITRLYAHQSVQDALESSHHGKCAFCEMVIPKPYADTYVEHFRPKGAVKQANGDAELRPGYYWLAYDWDNLLLACLFCNRDNKGIQFPLDNPQLRARNHHQPIAAETPLLIKPDDGTDPNDHIEFVEELPKGKTPRGKMTVKILGLDRLEHRPRDDLLVELREAYDQVMRYNHDPHEAARELVAQGRALYEKAPKPSSPFSAMAAAFVVQHPLPEPTG